MKAYSVAMLPGKERTNLSYGGKSTFVDARHNLYPLIIVASNHASLCTRELDELGLRITVDVQAEQSC